MAENDRIHEKLGKLEGQLDIVIDSLAGLPCSENSSKIAKLEVKAGIWGALSGLATALISIFAFKK